jgi:hypothetical protein
LLGDAPHGNVHVPTELRDALAEVFGATNVDAVGVVAESGRAKLFDAALGLLGGGLLATTTRNTIHLPGGADSFFADDWLVLHEYYHVLRQWNPGSLTTAGYLLEELRPGPNRFESEASAFADENLERFMDLRGRCSQ